MKKAIFVVAALIPALALATVAVVFVRGAQASGSCAPTGYFRDSINMTAALINPTGTVSGDVDASGCNVAVYYGPGSTGTVKNAEIHGANYFGVLNNGGAVNISNSNIHDIGEHPFNGTQHGVGVYFAFDSGASGTIENNQVWHYQKGGIVVNGTSDSATVTGNTVTGLGPVNFIAQNGIQIGYGATATVMRNTVSGNSYTGTSTDSGGILVVGGDGYGGPYTVGTQIVGNTVVNNDVGVYLSNVAGDGSAPTTATNIKVVNNTISNDAVNNNYTGVGYQAGISDQGNNDKMINNTISGLGYTPDGVHYLVAIDADTSFTNRPKVRANTII